MSIDFNSIRLGGPAHGIVIKIVHKTLPRGVGWAWWSSGFGGLRGLGIFLVCRMRLYMPILDFDAS